MILCSDLLFLLLSRSSRPIDGAGCPQHGSPRITSLLSKRWTPRSATNSLPRQTVPHRPWLSLLDLGGCSFWVAGSAAAPISLQEVKPTLSPAFAMHEGAENPPACQQLVLPGFLRFASFQYPYSTCLSMLLHVSPCTNVSMLGVSFSWIVSQNISPFLFPGDVLVLIGRTSRCYSLVFDAVNIFLYPVTCLLIFPWVSFIKQKTFILMWLHLPGLSLMFYAYDFFFFLLEKFFFAFQLQNISPHSRFNFGIPFRPWICLEPSPRGQPAWSKFWGVR